MSRTFDDGLEPAISLNGKPLTTLRGPLNMTDFPYMLSQALEEFDLIRANLRDSGADYDMADFLASLNNAGPYVQRLQRGARRITTKGLRRIGNRHGLCKVYMSGRESTFRSLNGLFYWNDGRGQMRREILLLAWKKGIHP